MADFEDAIAAQGFLPPRSVIWDGKIHRFPTDPKKPHSKDGWYVAHDDALGRAGAFGSMRDQVKHVWGNGSGRQLTADELRAIDAQRETEKKKAAAAKKATALRAQRIYSQASDTGKSDYLERKKMSAPDGCKFVSLLDSSAFGFKPEKPWHITGLIVPMRNPAGEIVNLQVIPNGSDKKLFMPESQTSGTFHLIGGDISDRVVIAEGIATAQAILPRSKCPVAVAFSASNLPAVARIFRAKYPSAEIIIAADGDPAGKDYAAKALGGLPGKNRIVQAPDGQDFWDTPFPDLSPNLSRQDLLVRLLCKTDEDGKIGKILPRMHNYIEIFSHAEEFAGKFVYNEFSDDLFYAGKLLEKNVLSELQASVEKEWIADRVSRQEIEDAAYATGRKNPIHPLRDYLLSLRWDGIDRIAQFFPDHLGTESDPYHCGVGKCFFSGAVRRVLYPGCQMDSMVILHSKQGLKKSSLWEALGGEWYIDVTQDINDVDFFIALQGMWISDLGELDQFSKAATSRIKQVLTIKRDNFRGKYERRNGLHPRQSVFVGGTNRQIWNADDTGSRRFLPISFNRPINIGAVKQVRDQLWAEAVHHVHARDWEDWWNVPSAEEHQDSISHVDPWTELVRIWLVQNGEAPVQCHEILEFAIGKRKADMTSVDERRVSAIMQALGWKYQAVRQGGYVRKAYKKMECSLGK